MRPTTKGYTKLPPKQDDEVSTVCFALAPGLPPKDLSHRHDLLPSANDQNMPGPGVWREISGQSSESKPARDNSGASSSTTCKVPARSQSNATTRSRRRASTALH